ncbi:predicted protein [Chaetoceros tenuissimus]|uniref:G-protein coupled receptors family 1 profile domain-containing protein n=1 Tax=Chaetoceros tenuissimus TaxID=426638 RepID=A0AAD3CDS9_9STRA|nr:predicted protein [Chaetoceros tenuissimus]
MNSTNQELEFNLKSGYVFIPIPDSSIEKGQAWEYAAAIQITTASISFIASAAMIISIARNRENLQQSPYIRLIFSLGIADLIQSLLFIIGPFTPPSSFVPAHWAIGNQTSCRISGAFMTLGSVLSVLNYSVLSFYYLCKLKKKFSDQQYSIRFEKKIYIVIYLFSIACVIAAGSLNIIGPERSGFTCVAGTVMKTICRSEPEQACAWDIAVVDHAKVFLLMMNGLLCFLFLSIIISMGLLCWHVILQDRIYRKLSARSSAIPDSLRDDRRRVIAEQLRAMFLRQTLEQGFLYCSSVILCYAPTFVYIIMVAKNKWAYPSVLHQIMVSLLQPLSGLLNIIIYTRLDIFAFRQRNPEYSRVRAFIEVLKSGGKIGNDGNGESGTPSKELSMMSVPFGVIQPEVLDSVGCENLGSYQDLSSRDARFVKKSEWSYIKASNSNIIFFSEDQVFDDEFLNRDTTLDFPISLSQQQQEEEESPSIDMGGLEMNVLDVKSESIDR